MHVFLSPILLYTHTRRLFWPSIASTIPMLRNINAYAIGYENKWDIQSQSGAISPKWSDGLVSCFQSEWIFHLIRKKLCIFNPTTADVFIDFIFIISCRDEFRRSATFKFKAMVIRKSWLFVKRKRSLNIFKEIVRSDFLNKEIFTCHRLSKIIISRRRRKYWRDGF